MVGLPMGGTVSEQEDRLNRRAGQAFAVRKATKQVAQSSATARDRVAFEAGRAAAIGMQHQQASFSEEQKMLQEMFGHGDKIWSVNNEPVRINNDLHPSMNNNPFEEQTSDMFGFGDRGERSGMF